MIFMKCTHVCAAQKVYYFLINHNKTWFPFLIDEIAEPRPDMNIKVAAFTVSEKSSIICVCNSQVTVRFTSASLRLDYDILTTARTHLK